MTLFIILSLILSTIILAIVLQRIIHCPVLVGFAFFSIFLLVSAFLGNTTFIIYAILLGILAFLAAFFDCVFTCSGFFRNNKCLNCDDNNHRCNCCSNNNENTIDERLTILNSNGEVVARINGNSVTCTSNNGNNENNCGCNGRNGLNAFNLVNGNDANSSCGCCNNRYR